MTSYNNTISYTIAVYTLDEVRDEVNDEVNETV